MMERFSKLMLLVAILLAIAGAINAQEKMSEQEREKILAPFPKAENGLVRYVIYLEPMVDESLYKVEIIPGKVMNVDCNRHTLMGKIEERDLQGWGYTYYNFTTNGRTISTMMACHEPKEDRFVQAYGSLIRYNSKLPIVVFAPEGYEIKYKIWSAGELESSPVL